MSEDAAPVVASGVSPGASPGEPRRPVADHATGTIGEERDAHAGDPAGEDRTGARHAPLGAASPGAASPGSASPGPVSSGEASSGEGAPDAGPPAAEHAGAGGAPRPGLRARLWQAVFPFMDDLKGYTGRTFRLDLLAALTVAVVALPQSMAYAVIAGVHPKYGLYAAMLPVMVAALWGSSRYLVAGPTNAIAMLLFASLAETAVGGVMIGTMPEETRMAYIFGVAILAGLIQVGMGLARVGELVHFISHSVIVGFTAGAAVLIGVGQLRNLFGVSFAAAPDFPTQVLRTLIHLPETNPWALGVGLGTIGVALALRYAPRNLPGPFIAIVVAATATQLFGLEAHGVRVVGDIPQGLPPLSLPPSPDGDAIRMLFMPALAIALLGAVEALSIAKTLAGARGDPVDGSREFVAQGLANVAAGLTSGIPGSGSFTRSAVNYTAGARTRFAGVFTGVFTLFAVLAFAPLARAIPVASLAGILCIIAWGMVDRQGILLSLRATRADRAVLLCTFAATLLLDLEKAVFVGVLLSLGLFLRKVSHPRVVRLDACDSPDLKGLEVGQCCPNLAVYAIEGTLFFGAIDELEERLYEYEDFGHKAVVLHLRQVQWIDATGVHAFERFLRKCRSKGVTLVLSGAKPQVRRVLSDSGLIAHMGESNVTEDLSAALGFCYDTCLRDDVCSTCRSANDGACRRKGEAAAAAEGVAAGTVAG